jgi:hypothetical protein
LNSTGDLDTVRVLLGHEKIESTSLSESGTRKRIEDGRPLRRTDRGAGSWRRGQAIPTGSPTDFGTLIGKDTEKWAKVVKFSGARPD